MKNPVELHEWEYEWEKGAISCFSWSSPKEPIVIQADSFEEAKKIGYEEIKKLMLSRRKSRGEEEEEKFRFVLYIISLGDLLPNTYIINTEVVWKPPKSAVTGGIDSSIPDDDYYY